MRQPSSIKPFTPSPSVVLHPALQAALENLDVQIEEELIRYRRQRRNPTLVAPRRKPFPVSSSGATAIGILNHNIQLPPLRSSIYDNQTNQTTNQTRQATGQVQPSSPPPTPFLPAQQPIQQPVQQPVQQAAVSPRQPSAMAVPTAPPVSTPATPLVTAAETTQANRVGDQAASARITSYAEQHDLSAYTPSSTLQKFVQQPVAYSDSEAPDDYLASSEALLRSIAEEEPEQRNEPDSHSLLDTLLTPIGVGSMLLLVLASITLGYVIMNPASLGLWTPEAAPDSSNPSTHSPTSPTATRGAMTPSPNLASDEFVDLDLGTLSTLPKQPSRSGAQTAKSAQSTQSQSTKSNASTAKPSTPATSSPPQAAASAPPEIPVAPAPQPSLSTVVIPAAPPVMSVPEPAIPAPAPEPALSPEPISTAPPIEPPPEPAPSLAAAPTAPTAPNSYYYVVTEYSGDASLQQARSAVPDAYVRNLPTEGAKVQLGAFNDEAKAQELLQQLQQQGIEAEVYRP